MSNIQSNNFLRFPHEAYTKPEPELPPASVHLTLLEPGDEQNELKSTAIGSIVNASPQNAAFDRALDCLIPRELPKSIEIAPNMVDKGSFMAKLEPIPYAPGFFSDVTSKFVNLHGRPIAVVMVGKVRVPFYASSGQNPKKGVTPGKWYPLLGICQKTGWFNKTPKMKEYYGSEKLMAAAKNLDRFIGDVREDIETAPRVLPDDELLVRNFINRDMDPVRSELGAARHIETMAALIQKDIIPSVYVAESFLTF
jgi:hypothetical protein